MPDKNEPKVDATHTTEAKPSPLETEGSHTEKTVDLAERLPEDPEEQNDLA